MPSFEQLRSGVGKSEQPESPFFRIGGDHEQKEVPLTERIVCLSDIHNDTEAFLASLRERGVVDEHGKWRTNLQGPFRLMVTGDCINKQDPNREVLKFLKHLVKTAPVQVQVTLLVGNHELAVLSQATQGHETVLKEKWVEFLGTWGVISRSGPVLFLHRYPSIELVTELKEQWTTSGGQVADESWWINQRYRQAIATMQTNPEQSRAIFRACDDGGEEQALRGESFESYYQRFGLAIGEMLRSMGITTVIHGHRRQQEGGQQSEQCIPGILMINNDTAISSTKNREHVPRIGSVDLLPNQENGMSIVCAYKHNAYQKKGARVQNMTLH